MTGRAPSHPSRRDEDQELWRLVVEAAPNAILVVDRERRIVLANGRAEHLFGYRREELLGQRVDLLVPEANRASHQAHVAAYLADAKTSLMGAGREMFARRKDGSELPVEIGLNPIDTSRGVFVLAAIIDITERKRLEGAQQRLAAIVESSSDAIMSKTLDGAITSWNGAAARLYGYCEAEVIGRPGSMLIPEHLRQENLEALERVARDAQMAVLETVRRRKDGGLVDVALRLSPIRNAAGAIVGVSDIARDITEAKARDDELRRSNAELEQFAHVASHDLQEPLRMVANYTELLAQRYEGKLDAKADTYIFYASDGARRMQRLVTDLLAYSRVGSQGKPLVPVSTEAVVDSVLRSFGRLIRDSGATIERGPLPEVLADEVQLGQLFQNLIGNAIKFRSSAPPHVTVRCEPSGDRLRFMVADNGIGLDMQYADRIFQMFQRLHGRGRYEGSGIGLSIAKRIVERHGGRIWVESKLGAGTTLLFTLRPATRGET